MKLVAREGINDVRIARIAQEAGVSPSLLHYHFASRDALLAEALEHSYELAGTIRIGPDDEPAPVHEWLPELARVVGARPPRRIPRWLARPLGEHMVVMMCEIRGASNAKAKRELGWEPSWPTWREGFKEGLADAPATATLTNRAA